MKQNKLSGRKDRKFSEPIKYLLILLTVLAVEASVFQYRFFQPLLFGAEPQTILAHNVELDGNAELKGNEIFVYGTATLTLSPKASPVTSIKLLSDKDNYSLNAKWHDEGNAKKWINGKEKSISSYSPRESEYYITTQGKCETLAITVKPQSTPLRILSVSLNTPTYSIRWVRVILLFLIICGLRLLFKQKPWNTVADLSAPKDKSRVWAKRICVFYLLFMTVVFTVSPGTEAGTSHCQFDKVFYSAPDKNDAYMMQTDALSKGQLHLDIEPSEDLLSLENPYDPSTRTKGSYTWDFAFYNGKYYSYFGVVPVILFLLPFKLITGHFFSSYHFAFILGLAAAVMLSLVYREAVKRYIPKINCFAFCTGLLAVLSTSFLCYLSARSWFYEIPYNSALVFIFAALYCALKAKDSLRKRLCFGLSGLFFSLSVGSRPIALISFLLLLPVLAGNLKDTQEKKEKLILSATFLAPAFSVATFLAVWNGLRFGSPFDFGNAYQLTVSDIRFNSVTNLAVALDGFFQYVFRLPSVSGVFPFFKGTSGSFADLSHSFYAKPVVGLISYPVFWWSGAMPFVYKHRKNSKEFFALLLCGTLAGLIAIYSVSASGGAFERYTLDFKWIFALISVLAALYTLFKLGVSDVFSNLVFGVSTAVSSVISFFLCFMGEYSRVKSACPQLFYLLKDAFEFLY